MTTSQTETVYNCIISRLKARYSELFYYLMQPVFPNLFIMFCQPCLVVVAWIPLWRSCWWALSSPPWWIFLTLSLQQSVFAPSILSFLYLSLHTSLPVFYCLLFPASRSVFVFLLCSFSLWLLSFFTSTPIFSHVCFPLFYFPPLFCSHAANTICSCSPPYHNTSPPFFVILLLLDSFSSITHTLINWWECLVSHLHPLASQQFVFVHMYSFRVEV